MEEAGRSKSGLEGKVAFRPMEKGEESLSHMKRCSVSLIIRGKQNYDEVPRHTGQNGHSSKSLQIADAGEGVEKREPSYTVDRNKNLCNHNGKSYGGSLKN